MGRMVRTARGLLIDYDAFIIKNSHAQAQNSLKIEVSKKKALIDEKLKETKKTSLIKEKYEILENNTKSSSKSDKKSKK